MNYLSVLLERLDKIDRAIAKDLRGEIRKITDARDFGLVFAHHVPETVDLPGRQVRTNDKVRVRNDVDTAPWVTANVKRGKNGRQALLVRRGAESAECTKPVADLVVVADFRDPLYPGLRQLGRIERGGDKPFQVVINAENFHALETLRFQYAEKVDCIYIDPPYNLGGDLTYNDKRISKEDGDRHSMWLAFMDRRLRAAVHLLSDTGVIIVAIDDTEHAHLKLLMDDVFDEQNFIANVVWQGGRKNDSRYVSVGHDYMLIYAKSEAALHAADIKWRERKPGIERVVEAAAQVWQDVAGDKAEARKRMLKWFRALDNADPAKAMSRYTFFNNDGTLARDDNITWPGGGGPTYDVLHPTTGLPVPIPERGWILAADRMQVKIDNDEVIFGIDHTKHVSLKRHLGGTEGQVVMSVFDRQRTHGSRELKRILGEGRFTHPKDTAVLARWIDLVTGSKPDAVVLDFFAGSGSTAHAVMALNAQDGGRRQAILVTNNEVNESTAKELTKAGHAKGDREWEAEGIFQKVTRPRLEAVVTGKRPDGSTYSAGVEENVEFFELTYEDRENVRLDMAFEAIAPMLWMRAGATRGRVDARSDTFALTDTYGVLFNPDHWKAFTNALHATSQVRYAFVVSESDATYQAVVRALPPGVEPVRLYEGYLRTFEINRGME